jgi:mannose-6-phosphate isomerase-like protein (cupin superfamily)
MRNVPRRVVTGHTAAGRSTIASDGPPEREQRMALHGVTLREIWNTQASPALIGRIASEPREEGVTLAPPRRGTRIRVCDFDPERHDVDEKERAAALSEFAAIGGADAFRGGGDGLHAMMHRTETVDYGIVLEGEIVLVLEETETLLKAGDVVVQFGTNHAWSNRSDKVCRMAFVLIDGAFDADLR